MYRDNQPFSLIIADSVALGACAEAVDYLTPYKHDKISTVIPLIADLPAHGWAYWLFRNLGPDLTLYSQNVLLQRLAQSPNAALRLYLICPFLTDDQDDLLWDVIVNNLPTATQEILDGVVTRAKTGGA